MENKETEKQTVVTTDEKKNEEPKNEEPKKEEPAKTEK